MSEDAQGTVEVEGQLTREDFVTYVMRTSFGLARIPRAMAFLFVTLGLLFVVVFLWERDATALVVRLGISLVGVVLWALLLAHAYRSSAVKQFPTYQLLQEPTRYRFTAGGVSSATARSQSSIAWSGYYRIVETKQAFYLYAGAGAAHIIPKRFFDSEEQMERFRALLRSSLPPEVCKL